MVDIKSFTLNLPSFIERSYYISPGVVSVVSGLFWMIITFLVVTFFTRWGFAAAGIKKSDIENEISLWHLHRNYSNVQSVSNGRWGGMVFNLTSARVILGFLFWLFIYGFELLFSLSIDNGYVTHYNGTACVGRVDNFSKIFDTMFDRTHIIASTRSPKNATLLRQLLNENQVGNIVLLGDGIFAISPTNALYKKNQTINVARAFFQCNHSVHLGKTGHGILYSAESPGKNVSLPSYRNFNPSSIEYVKPGYLNLVLVQADSFVELEREGRDVFFVLVSNPVNQNVDINKALYNSNALLQECLLFYEYGAVTITDDGYLNETNIGKSYSKVLNNNVATEFDSYVRTYLILDRNFLSFLDYPNELLDVNYNKTYSETMKVANRILAAHLLNGLDPSADLCTFNQEQVPIYFSVLGTRMSFGYILLGVAFVLMSLLVLFAFVFIVFSKEERNRWLLYSDDRRFAGYISTGTDMDKKTFNIHAKNIYIKNKDSMDVSKENDSGMLNSDSLLQKK